MNTVKNEAPKVQTLSATKHSGYYNNHLRLKEQAI